VPSQRAVCCPDFLRAKMSRRALLKVGGLGLAGLSLSNLLEAEARAATQGVGAGLKPAPTP
jgi:hypothetical protein